MSVLSGAAAGAPDAPDELARIYARRFAASAAYRREVWGVLVRDFFAPLVPRDGVLLELGCGYGEFINLVAARTRYGMDLNPETGSRLDPGVRFLHQSCAERWPLPDASLDLVFTSNFLEHLPDKASVGRTLDEAHRCLAPAGRLVAMGPNVRFLPGAYWDFWDHHVPLSERSLGEGLEARGFTIERSVPRFLPYTMSDGRTFPLWCLRAYLHLPLAWRLLGRQFLIVARRQPRQAVAP